MANNILQNLLQQISLLWYEEECKCLLCDTNAKQGICLRCQDEYFLPQINRCLACGKLIPDNSAHCKDCKAGIGPKGLNKVISLGHYDKAWKEFIRNVKYHGQPYSLMALSELLVDWVITKLPVPDAIVPVPMHPNKLAVRGFNQAEVLASIFSRNLGIHLNDDLIRIKDTPSQTILGRKERIQNLKGAFVVKQRKKINADIVWLVDDVTTTGATLGECAEILKENGVQKIYAICLGAGKEEKSRII